MRNHKLSLLFLAALFLVSSLSVMAQVQFSIPIQFNVGVALDTLRVGVSGDGPGGAIEDNTYGLDVGAAFGAFSESTPPPPDPDGNRIRFVDIPGRTEINTAGGLFPADYRGFSSASQSDTFAVRIDGLRVETSGASLAWGTNLSQYGTSWTLCSRAGNTLTPVANMLTSTSYTFPAVGGTIQMAIVKVGAIAPTPGPTFVLSSASLNFGAVPVGGSATLPVTVTNTGSANALSITGVTTIAPYTVAPNTFPISVPPGGNQVFNVTFSPVSSGTVTGNIQFSHNAPGSPTALGVSGSGQSQGGQLEFAAPSRTRFDNTNNYQDTLQLNGYVGAPLKALQFNLVTNGLTILRSVSRGAALPAPAWNFSSVLVHGPSNPDGSSNDTIKVVLFGNGSTSLPAGSYSDLVRFQYDVVNISDPDVQTASIAFGPGSVLGSTAVGENAGVAAGAAQALTVNNRANAGDINNDDHVDILDLLLIVDHILNRITLTGQQFTRADIAPWPSGDGAVNVQDLALLQNVILTGQYPDGTPVGRPVHPTVTDAIASLSKLNPGVDALVTFHITSSGIAVRLENAHTVKGMQLEFDGVNAVPEGTAFTSALGDLHYKVSNSTLRVLAYNQTSDVIEPGDRIVAYLPFDLVSPSSVTIQNVVLAGSNNQRFGNVEVSKSNETAPELPVDYQLSQNFPNPFNPTTTIRFSVPEASDVRISIYNMLGQEVRTLFAGAMDRGTKAVAWDGKDNNGLSLTSGSYIYRMTAGSFVESHKMMLLK